MAPYAYYPSSLGLLEIGYGHDAITSLRIVSQPLHGHRPTRNIWQEAGKALISPFPRKERPSRFLSGTGC